MTNDNSGSGTGGSGGQSGSQSSGQSGAQWQQNQSFNLITQGVPWLVRGAYSFLSGGKGFVKGVVAPVAAGLVLAGSSFGVYQMTGGFYSSEGPSYVDKKDDLGNQGYLAAGGEFYPLEKEESVAMSLTSLEEEVIIGLRDKKIEKAKNVKGERKKRTSKIEDEFGIIEKSRAKARESWGYDKPSVPPVEDVKLGKPEGKPGKEEKSGYATRIRSYLDDSGGSK